MSEVEEIKNRLNIADIIGEYMQLISSGVNFKAKCPFHNEKTPSFYVSSEKQIWHCFGCGEGGDVFTFVQKMEGIEFREALKILAGKAGVKLEVMDPNLETKRGRLIAACDLARRFYHQALLRSKEGGIGRDYLKKREVTMMAWEDFSLGYSPNGWQVLNNFLKQKGFSETEIREAGLGILNGDKSYDRFRGRLMFPINNIHGETVGFGARVLDEKNDQLGKYINSPQGLLYDKSKMLYGIEMAKMMIKDKNLCIVVEGYLDVISSHSVGIKNVVGVSGTALTVDQINLIKRYTRSLALCFDADAAGLSATKRGLANILGTGMTARIISLPSGEDPDSLIRKDIKLWQEAIDNSKEVIDFYFDTLLKNYNPEALADKKIIAAEILPLLKMILDPIEQAYHLQHLSGAINIDEETLRESMNQIGEDRVYYRKEQDSGNLERKSRIKSVEEILGYRLLGLGFLRPETMLRILKGVILSILPEELQTIYKKVEEDYSKEGNLSFSQFREKNKTIYPQLILNLEVAILDVEKDFTEENSEILIFEEVDKDLIRLKGCYYHSEFKKITEQIKKAEVTDTGKEKIEQLSIKLNELALALKRIGGEFV